MKRSVVWYDGYRFGSVDVYCPWDVICYCSKHRKNKMLPPQNYWLNTSGNEVIKHFINEYRNRQKTITRTEMERLIDGEAVQKEIRQELTYPELYSSSEHIWSALFMTGYLTQRADTGWKICSSWQSLTVEVRKIYTVANFIFV